MWVMFYFFKTGMKNPQHLISIRIAKQNLVDFFLSGRAWLVMDKNTIPAADESSTNFQRKHKHWKLNKGKIIFEGTDDGMLWAAQMSVCIKQSWLESLTILLISSDAKANKGPYCEKNPEGFNLILISIRRKFLFLQSTADLCDEELMSSLLMKKILYNEILVHWRYGGKILWIFSGRHVNFSNLML